MSKKEMPLVKSEDATSTIRFKPMRLDRKDIDLTHYVDAFELIKDLVNSSMANERSKTIETYRC